jgi:hypothetical protein
VPEVSDSTGAPDAAPAAPVAGEMAYENTADQVWGTQALELYQRGELQVEAFDTEGVVSAQVWGPCPRCGHDLNVQETLSLPVAGLRGHQWDALTGRARRGGSRIPDTIEAGCGCAHIHPGAPARADEHGTVRGCGVSFRLPTVPPPAP